MDGIAAKRLGHPTASHQVASYSICDPELRKAIEQFLEVALGSEDSLFAPGTKVWSPDVRADLYDCFVPRPDETPGAEFRSKY